MEASFAFVYNIFLCERAFLVCGYLSTLMENPDMLPQPEFRWLADLVLIFLEVDSLFGLDSTGTGY